MERTAQCRVTVNKRSIKFHVEGTGKVYDGNQTAPVTIVIENSVEGDEVAAVAAAEYDSAMPGNRKISIRSITLTGADASKYQITDRTMTVDGTIDKMQGTEVSVSGVNETIYGKDDGKIAGVTAGMEWRVQGENSWTACPDGELTGLANGTYEIRMKGNRNFLCGACNHRHGQFRPHPSDDRGKCRRHNDSNRSALWQQG